MELKKNPNLILFDEINVCDREYRSIECETRINDGEGGKREGSEVGLHFAEVLYWVSGRRSARRLVVI